MSRYFTALAVCALLAGCDGENPFMLEETLDPEETEGVELGDPNVSVSNRFAYDPAQRLTMNSVELDDNGTPGDTSDDQIIINNLPFDGPDGRYVRNEVLANGAEVYRSQQTTTTGTTLTFATFIRADYLEATSAASGQWIDFGYAGANINRDSFALPGGIGEYVYVGNYAATRTFNDRGGIEIISGNVQVRLDELDFDSDGTLEGAIDATVFNRQREGAAGTLGLGDLPNIVLAVTRYDESTGTWEAGTASTFFNDGNARSSGIYEGMIGGPNGEEIGGYSIITGTADVQTVRYEVVTFQQTIETPVIDILTGLPLTDPATGAPITSTRTVTGTSSGLDGIDTAIFQDQIDARQNVVDELLATGVPSGATILGREFRELEVRTSYDAREIGVFIGDQVVP